MNPRGQTVIAIVLSVGSDELSVGTNRHSSLLTVISNRSGLYALRKASAGTGLGLLIEIDSSTQSFGFGITVSLNLMVFCSLTTCSGSLLNLK